MSLSLYYIQERYLEVSKINAPSIQERWSLNLILIKNIFVLLIEGKKYLDKTFYFDQKYFCPLIEGKKCHSVCISYKKYIWRFVKQMLPPLKKDVALITLYFDRKYFCPIIRGKKCLLASVAYRKYMSHFANACKMRAPLNLVLENIEYLWFYWTFCIVILDYGLKLHKLLNHTLVMLQKWLEIH